MIRFASDYQEGCLPAILDRLIETNLVQTPGYGDDEFCEAARARIREACGAPDARVFFLVGGTQTNAVAIQALLSPVEGVLSAETGHVTGHEAGAVEARGHKVLTLPQENGKISAESLKRWLDAFDADGANTHIVQPGMVYITHPTEMGTLYTLAELEAIRRVCDEHDLPLYLDGARLAYGLAAEGTDVTLKDIARLCDVFYIGGTKCGGLLGEALVATNGRLMKKFFTLMKQQGAVLAKGRLTGITFDALFTDGAYIKAGRHGDEAAAKIRRILEERGFEILWPNKTNQVFAAIPAETLKRLQEKFDISVWAPRGDGKVICRFCGSWATTDEDIAALEDELLRDL